MGSKERVAFYILIIFNIFIYSNLLYQTIYKSSDEPDISSAHPISQQKIGDEADPDILIIYEAEVDGETVYPTVIKEAK
ncbi:hypothetical protein AVP_21 [Aerococcus phage vB_AviM_AVP]|nr:hypothetical protein AVP_21 [Aerococcus phage vB_AviM_AVP]